MRVSKYYLPVLKDAPLGAEVISHKLMLRAGMIKQQSAGIYSWLPLGNLVLKKVENIIREEMNRSGAMEVIMPCIQPADLWKESNRYDSYGREMLRIKDRHENDLLFSPTAEEVITDIVRSHINSYKDFPKTFYQINWKFRDEIRPRFGVMRGREFLMKDGYSFDLDQKSAVTTYDKILSTYFNIFMRMGLKVVPVRADTGPIGGDLSHEFHVLAHTGESDIFFDKELEKELSKDNPDIEKILKLYAMADDMHVVEECPVAIENIKTHKGIEVGHVFYYGTKYSELLNAHYMNDEGKSVLFHGGCYGIGVSRLVAAIIESSHDDKGIIWPKAVAPFSVALLNLHIKDADSSSLANKFYQALLDKNIEVLYDDTDSSAGNKFSRSELIGIPYSVVVSSKLAKENKFEVRDRSSGAVELLDFESTIKKLLEGN
jgi:prolyl-tRNA synthetase